MSRLSRVEYRGIEDNTIIEGIDDDITTDRRDIPVPSGSMEYARILQYWISGHKIYALSLEFPVDRAAEV